MQNNKTSVEHFNLDVWCSFILQLRVKLLNNKECTSTLSDGLL